MAQKGIILQAESYLNLVDHSLSIDTPGIERKPVWHEKQLIFHVTEFRYKNRVRFILKVDGEYTTQFALIRGILEFSRSRESKVVYNSNEMAIDVDIHDSYYQMAEKLIEYVSIQTKAEIRFKRKLKEVINLEQAFKLQLDEAYKSLSLSVSHQVSI